MTAARILITGAGGQLGRVLATDLAALGEVTGLPRSELDIAEREQLASCFKEARPDWIVNCAAWTQVDLAEERQADAARINDEAVGALADAAADVGARVLHFSTDYVFGGKSADASPRPYRESDETGPLNVYGATKLAGEKRLLKHGVEAAILRTSWLYAADGQNFFTTVLRLGRERSGKRSPLPIVNDQIGTPTDVYALSKLVQLVIEEDLRGLFHAANHGQASWYDFAEVIFREAGIDARLLAVGSDEFPRPARRPAYSVLENQRLKELGKDLMIQWEDGVRDVVGRLAS